MADILRSLNSSAQWHPVIAAFTDHCIKQLPFQLKHTNIFTLLVLVGFPEVSGLSVLKETELKFLGISKYYRFHQWGATFINSQNLLCVRVPSFYLCIINIDLMKNNELVLPGISLDPVYLLQANQLHLLQYLKGLLYKQNNPFSILMFITDILPM